MRTRIQGIQSCPFAFWGNNCILYLLILNYFLKASTTCDNKNVQLYKLFNGSHLWVLTPTPPSPLITLFPRTAKERGVQVSALAPVSVGSKLWKPREWLGLNTQLCKHLNTLYGVYGVI